MATGIALSVQGLSGLSLERAGRGDNRVSSLCTIPASSEIQVHAGQIILVTFTADKSIF